MNCINCESERVVKNGKKHSGGKSIQRYLCNGCGKRFNERSGTPIARLRTPVETIAIAMKMRSEGLGVRATARVIGKSGSSITNKGAADIQPVSQMVAESTRNGRGHNRRR